MRCDPWIIASDNGVIILWARGYLFGSYYCEHVWYCVDSRWHISWHCITLLYSINICVSDKLIILLVAYILNSLTTEGHMLPLTKATLWHHVGNYPGSSFYITINESKFLLLYLGVTWSHVVTGRLYLGQWLWSKTVGNNVRFGMFDDKYTMKMLQYT